MRIPAEITDEGYFTRRPARKRVATSHYEVYINKLSDLTDSEQIAILDKISNIGGIGNLRVMKIGDNDSEA